MPELKTITIGGAVSGCSIESMSYRYGGFNDSCLEYEAVTGDGRVMVCSPEKNDHLFQMLHGSYGTLGLLTRLRFRLLPARPFIRLEYRAVGDIASYSQLLHECIGDKRWDFIDGIVHGRHNLVACLGEMVDSAPYLSSYGREAVYYRSTLERQKDYLPLTDYFFRYDGDCHWLTRAFPPLQWKPVRRLFGRVLLGSSNLIRLSRRLRFFFALKKRPDLIVDVFIPFSHFEEFFRWYAEVLDFYPLWIVPYRAPGIYPWMSEEHRRRIGGERQFIDCAIYGLRNADPEVDLSPLLEREVYELNGIKTLISSNHYDEQIFWKI